MFPLVLHLARPSFLFLENAGSNCWIDEQVAFRSDKIHTKESLKPAAFLDPPWHELLISTFNITADFILRHHYHGLI